MILKLSENSPGTMRASSVISMPTRLNPCWTFSMAVLSLSGATSTPKRRLSGRYTSHCCLPSQYSMSGRFTASRFSLSIQTFSPLNVNEYSSLSIPPPLRWFSITKSPVTETTALWWCFIFVISVSKSSGAALLTCSPVPLFSPCALAFPSCVRSSGSVSRFRTTGASISSTFISDAALKL